VGTRIQIDSDQTRDGAELVRLREEIRALRSRIDQAEARIAELAEALAHLLESFGKSRSGK
jgi:predicted  nucleic acid-binding Zn-ribbon protein